VLPPHSPGLSPSDLAPETSETASIQINHTDPGDEYHPNPQMTKHEAEIIRILLQVWSPSVVAAAAGPALSDLCVPDVHVFIGNTSAFGGRVLTTLFPTSPASLAPRYRTALRYLEAHSLIRDIPGDLATLLCRLAATDLFYEYAAG
jgi:hypothetical protein